MPALPGSSIERAAGACIALLITPLPVLIAALCRTAPPELVALAILPLALGVAGLRVRLGRAHTRPALPRACLQLRSPARRRSGGA